jgi:MerR family transcriptional regulator/heat shock protein HspR
MRYGVPQDENTPAYVISVAAEMAEMHPQTLRHYDQIGLVSPSRSGRQRLYSLRDIALARYVAALVKEGVNHEGIKRIIALNQEVGELKNQLAMVTERLNDFEHKDRNTKLAVYRPRR